LKSDWNKLKAKRWRLTLDLEVSRDEVIAPLARMFDELNSAVPALHDKLAVSKDAHSGQGRMLILGKEGRSF
jgi:hypothetical protein